VAPDPRDLTNPHVDAIDTMLAGAGYPTYISEVTDPEDTITYPYLVVHPNTGAAQRTTLSPSSPVRAWRWQVTAVGRDRAETAAALDRARAALVDRVPVVPGRAYGVIAEDFVDQPIRQDPTTRDPRTRRPVFFGLAQFTCPSVPAT